MKADRAKAEQTENSFPVFWYESNSCWGWVNNQNELKEKAQLKISGSSGISNVDEFLEKSKQHFNGGNNFGTRSEHTGEKSLRIFLTEKSVISDFLRVSDSIRVTCPECFETVDQGELRLFGGLCEECNFEE